MSKVAFLFTDGVEQVELTHPLDAVREAGADVELLSLEPGTVQGFDHLDHGDTFEAGKAVRDASPDDYDALVVPGASPTATSCAPTRTPSRSSRASWRPASRRRSSATRRGSSWRRASSAIAR